MRTSSLMQAYQRLPIRFSHGKGARLWDNDGKEYLDAIAGVGVTNLGHAHPDIARVMTEQAARLMHTSNMFEIAEQERAGHELCQHTGMERVFFCNSGAEANETALKIARLHSTRQGHTAPTIVVMDNAFHGRTLATLAATGNASAHQGYAPLMPGFIRVPFNDIAALHERTARNRQIGAVLLEVVQGEGGIRSANDDYLRALRALCDQHNWLLIVDEIQSGLGRTGTWFAFQHAGIQPDIVTLAKGLGNGFPMGACLARGAAAGYFAPGNHGSTFGGNPLACRIASEVLRITHENRLPQHAATLGKQLMKQLQTSLEGVPGVVAIRSRGLMVGIEMENDCTDLVVRALREQRLLINVTRSKTIRLLPPLIYTSNDIDDLVWRLERLLSPSSLSDLRRSGCKSRSSPTGC